MTGLLLYKICITMLAVLGLSFVAEKFSAKLAGLLSGYPIGTAIILHFYGLEYGANFAADAAVFNLCGLLASQCFAYTYYRASHKTSSIATTSILALVGYLVPAFVVSQLNPNRLMALGIAIIATSLFCILLLSRKPQKVVTSRTWSTRLVTERLILTAVLVLIVTEFADIVGPNWAGIFSAFPVALYPLVFLLHKEYGAETAQTILENFPFGLWSVITYALTVSLAYPSFGVIWGTLIGFAVATAVLIIIGIKPMLLYLRRPKQNTA